MVKYSPNQEKNAILELLSLVTASQASSVLNLPLWSEVIKMSSICTQQLKPIFLIQSATVVTILWQWYGALVASSASGECGFLLRTRQI
ncbi:hypothetical protein BpHYR1_023815 [Brachionus plicatilis]|uniref:Uncharacterized protein n=1 Tax=Brachionus plicatilis TaxID=10195 RepID=A0A3M7PRH8_BRAPC|nr:hypothetical protein BpHYR1_023815 [Brachionus plicatilis]